MIRVMITALVLTLAGATACGQASQPLTGPAATPSPASADTPIAATTPSPGATINVSGVLDRGRPVPCPSGEPCDPPATATFLVFSQPGQPDVRVHVDAGGSFALHLAPGAYTISAAPPPMLGRLSPNTVRVPSTGAISLRLAIS